MAAEPTFIGEVTVHGIEGTIAYTGVAVAENLPRSVSFEDTQQERETKDAKGTTVGVKVWDPKAVVEIDFMPAVVAGGGSIASSKTKVILPTTGAKVTLAAFPANSGLNSALWLYIQGGRIELGFEDDIHIKLPLRKYGTDIAATANS